MRAPAALLLAALLVHCAAFESEDTPAPATVSDADAGAPPPDAEGTNVTPEAGAGAPFCARAKSDANVVFCDDFDAPERTAMDQGGWGTFPPSPGATIVSEGCFSSPRCARIAFPSGGQPYSVSVATVAFPSAATELRLRLRMRAESPYGAPPYGLRAFALSLWSDLSCKVLFYPSSGIWFGCPGNSIIASGPIAPASTWSLVTLTVKKNPSGAVDVRVEVGEGLAATSRSVTIPAQAKAVGDTVGLSIGQRDRDGEGAVAFDDIVVDVK